jgi:hypothetical protein
MTIAISLKVNDGLVLAADSASSIVARDFITGQTGVINVYENANKVFNIHKQLPVGAITWGNGSIGTASISTLVKDFRELITNHPEHKIDVNAYTVKEIAEKFYEFVFKEHYNREFSSWPQPERPALGFIIGGYSYGATMAEEWRIDIQQGGRCAGPVKVRELHECGINWNGEPEAISRIIMGYSPKALALLEMAELTTDQIKRIQQLFYENLTSSMIIPAMPIKDVIDIAFYLVDLTAKFVKYNPGPPTVGGPIEVAAITKHEGFKWISRKHYFDAQFNPKGV